MESEARRVGGQKLDGTNFNDCDTADQFIEELLKYVTGDKRPLHPLNPHFIFRGQADSSQTLLPSVHREGVITSPPGTDFALSSMPNAGSRDRRIFLGAHIGHEMWRVRIFLESADRLGLPTPLNYGHFSDHERIVERLWNDSRSGGDENAVNSPFPGDALLPAVALAQHHGTPTRLLDWTESPLVAAFFAAFELSSVAGKPWPDDKRRPDRLAVIALNLPGLDRTSTIQIVYAPRHANTFLRVQKGVFTLINNANAVFFDRGEWPSIESAVDVPYRITRITLPASEADELLRRLCFLDITPHHLMPSLTEAARAPMYLQDLFKDAYKPKPH